MINRCVICGEEFNLKNADPDCEICSKCWDIFLSEMEREGYEQWEREIKFKEWLNEDND